MGRGTASSAMDRAPDPGCVSVVVSFLDAERFIEEAIDSVYAQSYPAWELLLVDDGSNDGSTELARAYAVRDPGRVRYLEFPGHENRGASAARNFGLAEARGEFVAFLDADDVWLPQRLGRSVELLRTHPDADMVYGESEYWHSWSGDAALDHDRVQPHGIRADRVVRAPELLIAHLMHAAALPCMNAVTVRRSAALRSGGFVESFRGMHEDQAFLAKFCLGHNVYVADECWDRYRQHRYSLSALAAQHGEVACARRLYLAWLRDFLVMHGMRGSQVWEALRYAERAESLARSGMLARAGRALLRVYARARMIMCSRRVPLGPT